MPFTIHGFVSVLRRYFGPTMDETVAPISRSAVLWASSPALFKTEQGRFSSGYNSNATEFTGTPETASQAATHGFVSGHDFSRAENRTKNDRALAPARRLGITFWIKCTQAALLAIAVCFSVGATDASSRYTDLNHRLMCTCGCSQILGECNHVGCTSSTTELSELRTGIAAASTDQEILDTFVGKYGAVVLAAPTTHGFDLVAWIAPFAVFAAALLGTILLVRRWANISIGKAQAAGPSPINEDPADRERREQIRRDTGEGGF